MGRKENFQKARDLTNEIFSKTQLKNVQETLEFLSRLTPAEVFLRDNYISVEESDSIWDYDARCSEISQRWKADQNILAMLHYRYDMQRIFCRSFFILYYVVSGNPEANLSKRAIKLQKGDLLFIGPDMPHSIHSLNDDTIVLTYYVRKSTFDKVFFECLLESDPIADFFQYSLYHKSSTNYLIFRTEEDFIIRDIMLSIYATLLNDKLYTNRICEAEIIKLFCCLSRDHVENIMSNPDAVGGSSIAQTIAYIRKNYATVTIDEAAAVAGYSKCYFSQCIHKIFGKTFSEILNETRIDVAAHLIVSSQLHIKEIAEMVGYKTMTHFYRCFKEIKHCTPMEWKDETRR